MKKAVTIQIEQQKNDPSFDDSDEDIKQLRIL